MDKKFRLINTKSEANLKLPFDFFEDIYKSFDPVFLKIYLYALYLCTLGDVVLNNKEIASKLSIDEKKIEECWDYLEDAGLLKSAGGVFELADLTDYYRQSRKDNIKALKKETKDIFNESSVNMQFKRNIEFFQELVDKPLNQNEYIEIYDLLENQKVPFEVLIAAASYSLGKNKRNISYISKVAINCRELGLESFESCEQYLHTGVKDEKTERFAEVAEILNLKRDFYDAEAEFVEKWCFELNKTNEEIKKAFDITVLNTGKLSFPYMDKVLCNSGKTAPEIKNPKKSAFHNYEEETYNYDEIMKKIRDKRKKG